MNLTSLLVSVIAVVAAVLGPMYGRESAEHLLDTRLDERAPYTTGLSFSVPSGDGATPLDEKPAAAPEVSDLLPDARRPFADRDVRRYWASETPWAWDRGGSFQHSGMQFAAPTYWREGMCDLARVIGRCPEARNEALMQATMARTLGLRTGDTFDVAYSDSYLVRTAQYPEGIDAQKRRMVAYRVVGTYTVPDPGSPAWFDLSRFTGLDDLRVPPQRGTGSEPTAPALLVAPASMTSQTFRVGVDRPVDTSAVDLAEMNRAAVTAQRFKTAAIDAAGGQNEVLPELDLASVFDQVSSERTLLSRVMVAALAPLVLLTLLLLFALGSTAAQGRRTHVALAKLRGQSRAQVLRFALAEPFLVVALAVPVGVAIAVGTAQVVARGWLHPGIPVSLDGPAVASLLAVVAAA